MPSQPEASVAVTLAQVVPFLRRYGRALTGSQVSGDSFAAATLEAILADPSAISAATDRRVAAFVQLHRLWTEAGAPLSSADTPLSMRAQHHMAGLETNSREALLLNVIEGFSPAQIAIILGTTADDVEALVRAAMQDMEASVAGAVLVIEDEAIIAADISGIVRAMGHRVTGTARTHDEATALALQDQPDLILADILLADRSSGIDAAREILETFPRTPVIFITAYPERLLTGGGAEPAFLIAKPFSEDQLRSSVGQAMFFASTETLSA